VLDFVQLRRQMNEMVLEQIAHHDVMAERIKRAVSELKSFAQRWEDILSKVKSSKTSWLVALPTGRLDQKLEALSTKRPLTVMASDGSQIFPDRHEVALCYLINIGLVALHYGTGEPPIMQSHPLLYYREEDLYEQWGGRKVLLNYDIVSIKRQLLEIEMLAELASSLGGQHEKVAFLDGSLILWRLEGMPEDFTNVIIRRLLTALAEFKKMGIPVAGYISSPGSCDVVNMLKVCICPYECPNCDKCESKRETGIPHCACIDGVTDAALFRRILREGEWTEPFQSTSKILERYGEHAIMFSYLNVGYEVVRVEMPMWVATDKSMKELVMATAYEQAMKGGGYPVVLAEAHERALIRGNERELFFRMLEETFIRHNVRVSMSLKMLAKRIPPI